MAQRCNSVCHQQCAKDANHSGDHANGNYGWNDGAAEQWAADQRRAGREAEPEHPHTAALRALVEARKAVAADPGGYMPADNERKAGKLAALHKAFADAEATLADSATVGSALLGGAR